MLNEITFVGKRILTSSENAYNLPEYFNLHYITGISAPFLKPVSISGSIFPL